MRTKTFAYDLQKDKRFTTDKFLFHVPITLNAQSKSRETINNKTIDFIKVNGIKHIIGIDVGGTKCAISYGLYDGENIRLVAKEKIKTGKPQETLLQLRDLIDRILETHHLKAFTIFIQQIK